MPMRYYPVQRYQGKAEPSGNIFDIIQMKHAQFGERSEVTKAGINGIQRHKDPIIFYETFGGIDSEDGLLEVYRQSCNNVENTVCIIGLNKKVANKAALESALPDTASLEGKLKNALQDFHKAYIIPFVWTDTQDKSGYTFPYFEVRSKLMETAESLAEGYKKCLFRWIDRDASNDSMKQVFHGQGRHIDIGEITGKKNVPVYITGAYNWETHAVPCSSTAEAFLGKYREFRAKLNHARTMLHGSGDLATNTKFLNLLKELKIINGDTLPEGWGIDQISQQLDVIDNWRNDTQLQEIYKESVMQKLIGELNKQEALLRQKFFQLQKRVLYTDSHKPRFYLPEPLLLMNLEAHKKMRENLQHKAAAADAGNSGQARESLAAFDPDDWKRVRFRSDFSVTKPSKKIGDTEYLHTLRELIVPDFTKQLLCTKLKTTRQSAFDNRDWAFVSGQNGTWDITASYSRVDEEKARLTPGQAQEELNATRSKLATDIYDNMKDAIAKCYSVRSR